jgi:hypothetical protein
VGFWIDREAEAAERVPDTDLPSSRLAREVEANGPRVDEVVVATLHDVELD